MNKDTLTQTCAALVKACGSAGTPQHISELVRTSCASPIVLQWLQADASLLEQLLANDLLAGDYEKPQFEQYFLPASPLSLSEPELLAALRHSRKLALTRFIWREVNQLASIEQSIAEISQFAEAVLECALAWAEQHLLASFGYPVGNTSGERQRLCILGMGKLGALELNLSSDIDLIFVFPEAGETSGGRRSISNQDYFTRLGRKIIAVLDTVNADGFVFRVDMRLRPYGGSGALAANFDAMQIYYQEQGREWERYALIKARAVAGDIEAGTELLAKLRPFVYRKYVDYSVIEALRELKRSINAEVKRKGMTGNIKLGRGGIREIEFVVQIFQLIYGGQLASLRRRSLLTVLPALQEQAYLSPEVVTQLYQAYVFLRRTEHAVMMFADAQTHDLPSDDAAKAALVVAMDLESWQAFEAQLQHHRERVQLHFDAVVAEPEQDEPSQQAELWPPVLASDEAHTQAANLGFKAPAVLLEKLNQLYESPRYNALELVARTRLNTLLPLLLEEIGHYPQATALAENVLRLIDAILRRSSYMVLLLENTEARVLLLKLMDASSWVTNEVIEHPVLLDELVQTESLHCLLDEAALTEQLALLTARESSDNLESHMDIMRRFKRTNMLRIAVAELSQMMPLMQVSDRLTELAVVLLRHSLSLAYEHLVQRHGVPAGCGTAIDRCGFAIVAYGKLGGLELSHRSDLDMVFIYSPDKLSETDGEKPVPAQMFYTRLAQRVIHILATPTAAGRLYEVDMRLRPSGNSGAVVSSLAAFEKYQTESAWTWEHQALVRARGIVGDTGSLAAFEQCRKSILCKPRDHAALAADVVTMRRKMLDNLLPTAAKGTKATQFHLKHSTGAIVDIEFMVQFAVLANASQYPELAAFPDNIRTLETLARLALLTTEQVNLLISAYKAYRCAVHTLSLQDKPAVLAVEDFADERAQVSVIWEQFFNLGE